MGKAAQSRALALIFNAALSCLRTLCLKTFQMTTFPVPLPPSFFTPQTLRAFPESTLLWVLGGEKLGCPGSTRKEPPSLASPQKCETTR